MNVKLFKVLLVIAVASLVGCAKQRDLENLEKQIGEAQKASQEAVVVAHTTSTKQENFAKASQEALAKALDVTTQHRNRIDALKDKMTSLAERVESIEGMAAEAADKALEADTKASEALAKSNDNDSKMEQLAKDFDALGKRPPPVTPLPDPTTKAPTTVKPTGTSPAAVTASGAAVSREKIEREKLAAGVTSRCYSSDQVKAGKVVITKRYGIVTVNNHIPGNWNRAEQMLPVPIALSEGITIYSDADHVTFKSDAPMEIEYRK